MGTGKLGLCQDCGYPEHGYFPGYHEECEGDQAIPGDLYGDREKGF